MQVQSLANWVMKFNPKEFVRNAELLKNEQETEESLFKDFTNTVMKDIMKHS